LKIHHVLKSTSDLMRLTLHYPSGIANFLLSPDGARPSRKAPIFG